MSISYPMILGPASLGMYVNEPSASRADILNRNYDINTTNDYFSMCFCLNSTKQVNDIGVYINAVSGTASAYLISLRTLDAAGDPTSANYGGSSGTVYLANQFVKGWNWIPLSVPATGTAGHLVAAHIDGLSGNSESDYIAPTDFLLQATNDGRSRTWDGTFRFHPLMAIRYSDGTVQGLPLSAVEYPQVNSTATPDEYGNRFTVPINMTCVGMYLTAMAANTTFRALLYEEENVIRVSNLVAQDEDVYALGNTNAGAKMYWEAVELTKDVVYRIVVQPTTATNIQPHVLTLVTGSYAYVFPGSDSWQATYRSNSGSFTDDPQKRAYMGVLVSHVSPPTGTTTVIEGGSSSAYAWAY